MSIRRKTIAVLVTLALVGVLGLAMASAALAAAPTITTLDPDAKAAGSSGFTLTVTGTGFVSGATAVWGATNLVTTVTSANSLTATVPAALVAAAGTPNVTVVNPLPAPNVSNALPFTITAPTLASIAPPTAPNTTTSLSFTLTGTHLRGLDAPVVTFKKGTTAIAASGVVAAPDGLTMSGVVNLAAPVTAPPGNYDVVLTYGASGSVTLPGAFVVTGPTLASIAPIVGANNNNALVFTLTGTGLNGLTSPVVTFKGTGTNTATITATGLVPAVSGLTMGGLVNLASPTTAPTGVYDVILTYSGSASVKLAGAFTVTGPTLTTIAPVSGVNNNDALPFTLTGTALNGLTTPIVTFKGTGPIAGTTLTATGIATPLGSTTQMTGMIDLASPVAPAGVYDVVLTYGGSATVTLVNGFAVSNPVPTVASISPTTAYVGTTQPLVLTVNGTGFVPAPALPGAVGSRIKIGARVTTDTTFVSATRLTVPLTAADVATASTVGITVVNPPLGGGVSNSANLTVAADVTAPVTTITGADTAWHNVPVVLTVGATDAQSGVKMTQYQIDTGAPTTVAGGTITVPAPADGSGDGAQTVTAWSTDWCGNVEDPGPTVTVNIDATGPKTVASVASSVKKGTKVTFGYRANDVSPKCKIVLKIKKGSSTQVKRSYSLGSKTSNKSLEYKVNPNLGKGTYKYYVYATDQAGNKQSKLGQKTFKVK